MLVNLPDDKQFWKQQVHLPDLTLTRQQIAHYLLAEGIEEEPLKESKTLKMINLLEKLTGKKIELK